MATATIETQVTPEVSQAAVASTSEGESAYLFSNEQFFEMVEADIFPREARVYLSEGRILQKMAKNIATDAAGLSFNQTLWRIAPPGWLVGVEMSVVAGVGIITLPDFILLRGKPGDYQTRRATAADVGLVVELSYTSLKHDTGRKMAAYAQAGFPIYWVANLVGGTLIEYRNPLPNEERYATMRTYMRGESLMLMLDATEVGPIAINDLLPVS